MSAKAESEVAGQARASFAASADVDEFVETLRRFEAGEIGADAWRAFRLVRGTYGQRQSDDAQMLRVKLPQGVLERAQLEALADVAERFSRGFGHVTTRQNVQFHFMKLHDVEPAMRRLAEAGLTTREACGNSVRNVTACPYAGIAADEPFDVTPYAEALTRHLLRHPLSATLPRKFKIAFEGCARDHVYAAINDVGFRARVRTGADGRAERGFRVTAGGGTATLPTSGGLLFEFLPAGDVLAVAEALVGVFHARGDRQHRQRNRMKFLIRELGFDAFRAAFEAQLQALRAGAAPRLPFDPEQPPVAPVPVRARARAPEPAEIARRVAAASLRGPGIVPAPRPELGLGAAERARFLAANVRAQRQAGYACVSVSVPLGDLSGAQLRVLGELGEAYADGTLRTGVDQNVFFRFVAVGDVAALHERLAAAGLGRADASSLADVTSCPGAESCKLAVTQSRGLGRLLGERLQARPDLVAAGAGLDVKISGCPNGCGQHHVAGIGFQGSVRKLGARVVPQYFVMLGGGVDETGVAHFGRLIAKLPARRVPAAVERLVALCAAERAPGEDPAAYFRRADPARLRAALRDLEALSPDDARPDDFIDLGEQTAFTVATQAGECSA